MLNKPCLLLSLSLPDFECESLWMVASSLSATNQLRKIGTIVKLCCYMMIQSTRADSPKDVWWTVSHIYTVLFLSHDVKNTKFNYYLPVVLTSLNMSNSRFLKLVLFWMWHYGRALWRWNNGVFLTTASNVKCWADVANHVTQFVASV